MTEIKHAPFHEEHFLKSRTAIIDGDGIAYAIGWNHKEATLTGPMYAEIDYYMHDTLQGLQARHYVGVLSPMPNMVRDTFAEGPDGFELEPEEYKWVDIAKPNFRYAIATSRPYKGQRKEKPEWYDRLCPMIEDYLCQAWGFVRTPEGFEADDLCATLAVSLPNRVIVHTDKDLKQISGTHFNPRTKEVYEMSQHEAWGFLYKQIIEGDDTDNIEGIPGWGKVAAAREIDPILSGSMERAFMLSCIKCYAQAYEKAGMATAIAKFWENYQLCRLVTDVPLDDLDEDAIRGYDLEANQDYNKASDKAEPEADIPQLF